MSITLNGTTGISTPDITSTTAPSLVGTNFTSLPSASLTGALPAIDGSALTGVGASTATGAVGTYMYARFSTVTSYQPSDTTSGSNLLPSSCNGDDGSTYSMSGTWRAMGAGYNSSAQNASLWVRTA